MLEGIFHVGGVIILSLLFATFMEHLIKEIIKEYKKKS